jgi:hypothetical protein
MNTTEPKPPEITINTDDMAAVKSALLADMLTAGYMMDSESESLMTFSRATKGGESFVAALVVGNAYSTNRRVTKIMLIKQPGSVRVVVLPMVTAQMPGGQVRSQELKSPEIVNAYHKSLTEIKAAIEQQAARK